MDSAAAEVLARDLLQGIRQEVDAALDAYLPAGEEVPGSIHEAMRYSVLAPGKRIRPALLLLAAEALGVSREEALPAACSLEFIHAFSLIHDDLPAMDDDDLRRGRPTNHKRFGEAVAILAGDALCALAFEVIARETRAAALVPRLVTILGEAVGTRGMIGGQVLDLQGEEMAPDLELVREIHHRKTAALIRAACRMAAVLGEADPAVTKALDTYGEAVGMAFQAVDDLLDETSTEEAMGKKTHKDRSRGKQTFPACAGLESTRAAAQDLVEQAIRAIRGPLERTEALESLALYVVARIS